jgi:hypothetical protein
VCYNNGNIGTKNPSKREFWRIGMEILKDTDFRKELKSTPRRGYLFFGE